VPITKPRVQGAAPAGEPPIRSAANPRITQRDCPITIDPQKNDAASNLVIEPEDDEAGNVASRRPNLPIGSAAWICRTTPFSGYPVVAATRLSG
jgi:hypothetical protein